MVKMPSDTDSKHKALRAGALICPACCVEYVEVEFAFEFDGIILDNVRALRCPVCQEEHFTPEQYNTIQERLRNSSSP